MTVKYAKGTNRWTNSEQFQTFPTEYVMKVNVYFNDLLNFDTELTHVSVPANDNLKWPKTFTMTVTILNRTGDHSHYHITKEDLEVRRRGRYNDQIKISYNTIDQPSRGVKYIINGHIKFQIFVREIKV